MSETTRREFIGSTLITTAGLCVGAVGCEKTPSATVAPTDGVVELELAQKPELGSAGGALGLEVDGQPILVFRREGDQFAAVSRKCTHLGCKVKYSLEDDAVVCPCHGSRFGVDGSVTKGPAKEPLVSFPVESVEGLIKIRVG